MSDSAYTILIAEDDDSIRHALTDVLTASGYEVLALEEGLAAIHAVRERNFDLALLDVAMPGADGFQVLQVMSEERPGTPVIMLTARVEEVDRLIGLELGADDYICKPFSPREVVARVKAVLRRTAAAQEPTTSNTQTANLMLDESHWQATLHGTPLGLTRREFKLLQVLARQTGRIFSRAQLLDQAFDDTLDVNERAIDSHIKNLRKKLKAASGDDTDWIRSVYGVGFALDPAASN